MRYQFHFRYAVVFQRGCEWKVRKGGGGGEQEKRVKVSKQKKEKGKEKQNLGGQICRLTRNKPTYDTHVDRKTDIYKERKKKMNAEEEQDRKRENGEIRMKNNNNNNTAYNLIMIIM